ncbi:MAG: RNA methyltransferase [Candidatus Cryptobacteroides sp.]|nr:RNA methyltransferase [Bacteroidales bacterium]MDY2773652.1 RNA methyltransferase [Candidatus Cryptobacteroides sp.]
MRIETITSAQNRKVKELLTLVEKSKARSAAGLFVVEGQRELGHCLDAGFIPETLFICGEVMAVQNNAVNGAKTGHLAENIEGKDGLDALIAKAEALNPRLGVVQIPAFLYEKVAYRGSTEGIIAEVHSVPRSLEDLRLGERPLVMVLESVEKPGNLGAVLRSADAAGADAVIVCDPLTDIWNPNLIRSSVGAVFSVPVAVCTSADAIAFLKERGIRIFTAQLQDSEWYYDTDMTGATALVMGTESTGLTQAWRDSADAHIKIPMLGRLDSLNVSVSAAVLLYEAVRQRKGGN